MNVRRSMTHSPQQDAPALGLQARGRCVGNESADCAAQRQHDVSFGDWKAVMAVSSKIVDKVYIRPVIATRDEMASESHHLVEIRGMSIARLLSCAAPEFYGHAWFVAARPRPRVLV